MDNDDAKESRRLRMTAIRSKRSASVVIEHTPNASLPILHNSSTPTSAQSVIIDLNRSTQRHTKKSKTNPSSSTVVDLPTTLNSNGRTPLFHLNQVPGSFARSSSISSRGKSFIHHVEARMKMKNHKEGVLLLPDWSKMPTEMLEQVCKLLTIPNQARFITVCKSWLSANTSKKAYHWIPDAPWLVSNDCTSTEFQVISTTDKQAYNIYKPFSPLQNTTIVGSSKGWLILRSDQSLFILNLFSKLRLDLPPISTMSCLLCSKGDDCFGMHTPVAFTISMCPNMNPTLVVVVTYKGDLGWCKVGDTTWKGYHTSDKVYSNVVFHDNKLYAVERGGLKVNKFKYDEEVLVQVGSVESTNPIEHVPNLSRTIRSYCMTIYLVECGGNVLVVKRFSDDTKFHTPTIDFVIFAVEENYTTPKLVKVENLDDHVLFVSNINIECLDAKYCPKFQRGSVYFTSFSEKSFITEVGVFSITDRTMHTIPLTNPQMHSPSPIWMMPRFSFECDCKVCTSAPWFRPRQLRKRHMLSKISVA